MQHVRLLIADFLSVVPAHSALAQETESQQFEPGFNLPGELSSTLAGVGGVDFSAANAAGSATRTWSDKWPEDLVIAPVPGRSPQLGWMLTLAGGYFLGPRDEETEHPPSVIGGFGMISENGSRAYGGGANLHLLEDRLRVKAGAAFFDVEYRYYGTGVVNDLGISVDVMQDGPMYFAEGSWRVWNKLYLGLGYLAGNVDSRAELNLPEDPFFDPVLSLDIGAYTFPIQYDTRDSETYPRSGWFINGRGVSYRKSAGADFDTETFKLAVNHYRTLRERDVLALRVMLRATGEGAPFFLQSAFGGKTDLRGYPSGRYRDRMMYAVQGEYRWQFSDRWIFTGFAGFGEVAESFGDMGEDFLPAAGLGVRFVLSTKHDVGLAADIAVGDDGAEFYFGVGESF